MEPDLHRNATAWQILAVTKERDRLKALNAELVEALEALVPVVAVNETNAGQKGFKTEWLAACAAIAKTRKEDLGMERNLDELREINARLEHFVFSVAAFNSPQGLTPDALALVVLNARELLISIDSKLMKDVTFK